MLVYPNGAEYAVIVSGKVALTNPDGSIGTFGPGESYILPPATEVRFEVLETMRKICILQTAKQRQQEGKTCGPWYRKRLPT